jgi:hypothetical protein
MPMLYLFSLQNLNCYPAEKNYAIISKSINMSIEELNEGQSTDFFGNENDIIIYKLVVPFLNQAFIDILSNYNQKSKIVVEKENQNFWCVIDGNKHFIGFHPHERGFTIFDYIAFLK